MTVTDMHIGGLKNLNGQTGGESNGVVDENLVLEQPRSSILQHRQLMSFSEV